MILENKYNVPRETWIQLCKDGIVPPSVLRNYDILGLYERLKSENPSRSNYDIFTQISQETKLSIDTIDKVVYSLRKK